MKSDKIINVFNKQIMEFTQQIMKAFPDIMNDSNVNKMYNTLETSVSLTPTIPIQLFYEKFVQHYNDEIMNRDADFFLQFDEIGDNPIDVLKYVYNDASEDNKKIIWDYVQRLRLLAIKYHQQKNSN